MATVITRIAPEVKIRLKRRAQEHGMTESELMRQLVSEYLDQPLKPLIAPPMGVSKSSRVTVSLASFLLDAAKQRAMNKGMACSRWIAALIQSNLMHLPVMTDDELIVIRERNRELAAIGRNLNQIARALNGGVPEYTGFNSVVLKELKDILVDGQNEISALVDAGFQNWEAYD